MAEPEQTSAIPDAPVTATEQLAALATMSQGERSEGEKPAIGAERSV